MEGLKKDKPDFNLSCLLTKDTDIVGVDRRQEMRFHRMKACKHHRHFFLDSLGAGATVNINK